MKHDGLFVKPRRCHQLNKNLQNIIDLLKPTGTLKTIFGYSEENEPTEVERLNLEIINEAYIKEKIIPSYQKLNLKLELLKVLEREELGTFETTWCKKLRFGKERPMFYLEFKKL